MPNHVTVSCLHCTHDQPCNCQLCLHWTHDQPSLGNNHLQQILQYSHNVHLFVYWFHIFFLILNQALNISVWSKLTRTDAWSVGFQWWYIYCWTTAAVVILPLCMAAVLYSWSHTFYCSRFKSSGTWHSVFGYFLTFQRTVLPSPLGSFFLDCLTPQDNGSAFPWDTGSHPRALSHVPEDINHLIVNFLIINC